MIVKTGVLSLESLPKGATVFLNDVEAKEKTPAVIDTVIPGEYQVRIIKDGYLSWEKTLEVESNQTTFAMATLFLADAPERLSPAEPVLTATTTDHTAVAYVVQGEKNVEVWQLAAKETAPLLIDSFPSPLEIKNIAWSPEGRYLLVETTDLKEPFSVYTRDGDLLLSLTDLFSDITDLWWDMGQDGFLFVKTDTQNARLNIANQLFDSYDFSMDAARMTSQGLAVIQQTAERATLVRIQNGETTILAYLPLGSYRFLPSPDHVFLLEDTRHQHLLLLDANGGDQPILLNDSALLWQWNTQGKLLLSDGFDLHIYDSYTHTDTLLTRTSERISALTWYTTQTNVIFCLPSSIQAIELDERGSRQSPFLAVDTSCTTLWMDTDGKVLSFFGTIGEERGWFEKKMQE